MKKGRLYFSETNYLFIETITKNVSTFLSQVWSELIKISDKH